jgi:hypothetical protein
LHACLQGLMLLAIGPLIDQSITQQWVLDYEWTQPALQQLLMSCGLAVLVNISQFMCLGRFSAVSFQVSWLLLASTLQQQLRRFTQPDTPCACPVSRHSSLQYTQLCSTQPS